MDRLHVEISSKGNEDLAPRGFQPGLALFERNELGPCPRDGERKARGVLGRQPLVPGAEERVADQNLALEERL